MTSESAPAPPAFEIVIASPTHDAAVVRLARESGLTVDPAAERDRSQSLLHVAATLEGEALGFVLSWLVLDELEVLDVCVDRAFREKGIGTSLLKHHLHHGTHLGATRAYLEMRESNVAARALYGALGFEEVSQRRRYYPNGETALVFRCCLEGLG